MFCIKKLLQYYLKEETSKNCQFFSTLMRFLFFSCKSSLSQDNTFLNMYLWGKKRSFFKGIILNMNLAITLKRNTPDDRNYSRIKTLGMQYSFENEYSLSFILISLYDRLGCFLWSSVLQFTVLTKVKNSLC